MRTVRFPGRGLKVRAALIALLSAALPPAFVRAEAFQFTTRSGWNLDGWNMVSFPFAFSGEQALPGPLFSVAGGAYAVETDPKPGRGYFLFTENAVTLNLEGSPIEPDERGLVEVPFPAGWSLLGNPFNHHLPWSDVLVDGVPIAESDKVQRGPIGFFWNQAEDPPNLGQWKAYWVKLSEPASIGFRGHRGDATMTALEARYRSYVESYAARHRHLGGGTVVVKMDKATHTVVKSVEDLGDSVGFTGTALAAFALAGEWDMARPALKYIGDCEDPATPGHLYRYPELLAEPNGNVTSTDQYTHVLMGLTAALTHPDVPDDVFREAKRLFNDIIVLGKANGWDIPHGASGASTLKRLFYIIEELNAALGERETFAETETAGWERVQLAGRTTVFNTSNGYFALNLMASQLISIVLLRPDQDGLDAVMDDFYRAVEGDQNTLFDIIYHWWKGDALDFAAVELSKFPDDLPNRWEQNGYTSTDFRWQRSPQDIARDLTLVGPNETKEFAGVDYILAHNLLRYAMDHPF